MDSYDFTEEEIREQLKKLGFHDVSQERLQLFKKDLAELVSQERSKNSDLFSNGDTTSSETEGLSSDHLTDESLRMGYKEGPPTKITSDKDQGPSSGTSKVTSLHDDGVTVTRAEYHRPSVGPAAEYRSFAKDAALDMTDCSERRQVKRKVLRKMNGESHICDESVTESETGTDDLSSLQERLAALPIRIPSERASSAAATRGQVRLLGHHRPLSAAAQPVYRLPEDYLGPKALIRPMSKEPHQQNVRKSDPVAQFHKYQSSWSQHRPPGDRAHKDLRWNVRENLLYQDNVVKKKQKVYIPNGYKVPSDKKRKNLRWQIRNDLAQGVVPPSAFD